MKSDVPVSNAQYVKSSHRPTWRGYMAPGPIIAIAKAIATRLKRRPLLKRPSGRAFRRRVIRVFLRRTLLGGGKDLVGIGQLAGVALHRILVLRPNHRLGNILLLTPLLSELGRAFPGAEIDVLVAGNSCDVLGLFLSVSHVHALPRYMVRHPARSIAMIAKLRRTHYDLGIDASTNSYSSRVALALVSPRYTIGESVGGDSKCQRATRTPPKHFAKLPVFLIRRALFGECGSAGAAYPPLAIALAPLERAIGRQIYESLDRSTNTIRSRTTIGVFASATGAKCYSESWWLDYLTAMSAALHSCEIIEFVPADGRSRLSNRFPTYYSTDIRKLASVISNLTCFVSADCGVMHLASASGVPTIGLFSASDPSRYAPYGKANCSLLTGNKTPEAIASISVRKLRCLDQIKRQRKAQATNRIVREASHHVSA